MDVIMNHLAELVVLAISIWLTPFLTRAITAAKERMDSSAILNKIDSEGRMRDALNAAIYTAVQDGLGKGLDREAVIVQGLNYVLRSVPDAVDGLDATTEIIRQKLGAAWQELRKRE